MLLDDFNRANSASLGADWALVPSVAAGGPSIVSNQAKIGNSPTAGAWLPGTYDASLEVSVTIRGVDGGGGTHSYLLAQMPDPAMGSFTGYVLDFEYVSGSLMTVTLYRGNAGTFTTLHATTGVAYATGDVFTLRKVAAVITALRNGSAISGWPLTDPSPLNASDTYVGFGGYNATLLTFDDFSDGVVLTVPDAPTLGSATAGDAQVDLAWSAPADDGGSAIAAYKVYRGVTAAGETVLATLGVVLAYSDTVVLNGTEYFYKVTAANGVGESALSNERSATPVAPGGGGNVVAGAPARGTILVTHGGSIDTVEPGGLARTTRG